MAFLPSAVVHNWRLKLAALGLSVFLWALVQTEPRNAESFSAPVLVEVADTAWTVAAAPDPATVELRLTGPTREIIRLAREGTLVRVPVQDVGSADTAITLRREWVALGEGTGLSVESMLPNAVRVSFEPAVTRVLPVAMRLEGELPDHLALASPVGLNPQVIRVRGPASRVEGLDSLRLRPLDLASVTESGIYQVAVDTTGLAGARLNPAEAALGIRVEDELERVLAGLPVQVVLPDGSGDLVVRPSEVDVRLRGARTLVTAVDPRNLTVVVDPELIAGMVAGEERRVPLDLQGVPALVEATLLSETVLVQRAADLQDDSGAGGGP